MFAIDGVAIKSFVLCTVASTEEGLWGEGLFIFDGMCHISLATFLVAVI